MARKHKHKGKCKGQNQRTGRLKKGYRWKRGHGCPVKVKKK